MRALLAAQLGRALAALGDAVLVLDGLLDASLLQRIADGGSVRLGLLEAVRLYAAGRLAALAPDARGVMLGDALTNVGRDDDALATHDEAEELGRALADAAGEALAIYGAARILLARRRPAEAVRRLRRARELLAPLGVGVSSVFVDLALAEALHATGHRDEATALLDEVEPRLAELACTPDSELARDAARIRGIVGPPS